MRPQVLNPAVIKSGHGLKLFVGGLLLLVERFDFFDGAHGDGKTGAVSPLFLDWRDGAALP